MHLWKKDVVVGGNGCAGAERSKALRESGRNDDIHLFTGGRWPKDAIVVKANFTQMVRPGVIQMCHGYPKAAARKAATGE